MKLTRKDDLRRKGRGGGGGSKLGYNLKMKKKSNSVVYISRWIIFSLLFVFPALKGKVEVMVKYQSKKGGGSKDVFLSFVWLLRRNAHLIRSVILNQKFFISIRVEINYNFFSPDVGFIQFFLICYCEYLFGWKIIFSFPSRVL